MSQPTYISGLLFSRAHALVRGRIQEILIEYSLNPSDWAVLGAALNAPEGIRLSSVAKDMGVKAPLVTMLATQLIDSGLITRVPHHSDKRAKLLIPTIKGRKLGLAIEEQLAKAIEELMSGVEDSDAKIFQNTLETIITNAEKSQ
jgi:DNA-binding MarR family transcriptional regulator